MYFEHIYDPNSPKSTPPAPPTQIHVLLTEHSPRPVCAAHVFLDVLVTFFESHEVVKG